MWCDVMAWTAPPSFVDHGPRLRVLITAKWEWPETAKKQGEPRKMTHSSERPLVILGQALLAHLVPCLWVGWWLWRAGCISQDTYFFYDNWFIDVQALGHPLPMGTSRQVRGGKTKCGSLSEQQAQKVRLFVSFLKKDGEINCVCHQS